MGNRCFGAKGPAPPATRPADPAAPPATRPAAPQPANPRRQSGPASAYIPNLEKLNSEVIREKWSDLPREKNPPCHAEAIKQMNSSLHASWVSHTGLLRQMREATKLMKADTVMTARLASSKHFEMVMVQVVKKGYELTEDSAARQQMDVIHSKGVVDACIRLWNSLDHRRKHLTYAMELLRDLEKPSGIVARLSEICDRADRCMSAKRQAFVLAVTNSYQLPGAFGDSQQGKYADAVDSIDVALEDGTAESLIHKTLTKHMRGTASATGEGHTGSDDTFVRALERVYECVELFLDSFKEKAFLSAFIEPARCYFSAVGDTHQRDHVNIHGINWYLALLHAGLGVQLPLMSAYNDGDNIGVCDFWEGLTPEAWAVFSDERNFGMAFEGIKAMRTKQSLEKFIKKKVPAGQLPVGHVSAQAKKLGNEALAKGGQADKVAVYLERYAHFFRRAFLAQRMFEGLNSESQPEYVGFRKACDVLYASYPLKEVGKESFVEFVYVDEYFIELDLQRVEEFFEWILVFAKTERPPKPMMVRTESSILREKGGGKETCPICMEEKDDVELLDHWMPQGDVSEHKMCGACQAAWKNQEQMECPFCRELLHADEMTTFITHAVATVSRNKVKAMVPDESAAIMEQWQMMEMMLQGQQAAIRRVAKLVVEHKDFASTIVLGTSNRCAWLRDMAGIVFRLDAMFKDGELKVSQKQGKLLADAVESFMTPLEGASPLKMDAHFYGALYMQAVTPWLCAWRAQAKTKTLGEHVRRVGKAIELGVRKHGVGKKQIQERLLEEYVQLAHEPVWGSQAEDVLYQTVYK
mmetsp:Transcript_12177/g.24033  ORF Transcript_12177/g.24033 Transcript_12177/m.24033 type:complete len:811 (+) Transcript_12177:149-2581(+)